MRFLLYVEVCAIQMHLDRTNIPIEPKLLETGCAYPAHPGTLYEIILRPKIDVCGVYVRNVCDR